MKIILKLFFILILAEFPIGALFAQQDILSANCNATGNGGTVSWSIGLVDYSAWSSTTGTVTEGVQQPYEFFIISGLEEFESSTECTVFPNPTTGKIILKFLNHNLKNLSSCIFDLEGARLREIAVDSEEISIPMDDLKPATYFLVILENDRPVKTYKIIKK